MNNRVSLIYQVLLLTSIISSGLLFIIVAAEHGITIGTSHKEKEELQEEDLEKVDVEKAVHDKPVDYDSSEFEILKDEKRQPDQEIRSSFDEVPSEERISLKEQPLKAEPGSLFQNHASITDEPNVFELLKLEDGSQQLENVWPTKFSETGHAVVLTLVDSASRELQQQAAVVTALLAESGDTDNDTKVSSAPAAGPVTVPLPLESDAKANETAQQDDLYVVRAEPKQVDATSQPTPAASSTAQQQSADTGAEGGGGATSASLRDTGEDGAPPSSEAAEDRAAAVASEETANNTSSGAAEVVSTHEEIPSFSEWAQKQLAEAEKKKAENKTRGGGAGGQRASGMKRSSKNYASPDCGAKVVSTNPEASSVWAVLSTSRDEYLLNSCNNKIWFIVELCEAIQPEKIELANFELFSSILREFSVSVSDRHPTREWTQVGQFEAKEVRTIQSFGLKPTSAFVKYIRVEFHSHYGTEHYCPISLFRVYGTSEFEVLDTVDEAHAVAASLEEDEDEFEEGGGGEGESVEKPRNLFSSARDAVLSIVKRAAQVLVKGEGEGAGGVEGQGNSSTAIQLQAAHDTAAATAACVTPAYIIVCDNCSDQLFNSVHHLLSCHTKELDFVLESNLSRNAVTKSDVCKSRGLDLLRGGNGNGGAPFPMPARTSAAIKSPTYRPSHYLQTMLPHHTIIALCNLMAISRKQVVLNITYDLSKELNDKLGDALGETVIGAHTDAPLMPLTNASPSTCTVNSTTASSSGSQDASSGAGSKDVAAGSQTPSSASVQIKPTKTFLAEDVHSLPVDQAGQEASSVNATVDGDGGHNLTTATESLPVVTASQPVKAFTEDLSATATATESLGSEESILDFPEEAGAGAGASAGDSLTFDSIFSELDEVADAGVADTASLPTSPPQTQQRESVLLRLAKRIKALERNMSLSGQYLEELSRRYKRQVEEMQRSLNEVVEERRRHEEKEERRGQQVARLTQQVAKLTLTLEALIDEKNSWTIKHGAVIIVEVVVFAVILLVCRWLPIDVELGARTRFARQRQQQRSGDAGVTQPPRRSSIDGSSPLARPYPPQPRLRKRRPSEEALRISGSTHQDLLIPDASRKNSRAENRRRRRKKKDQQQQQTTFYVNVDDTTSWSTGRQMASSGGSVPDLVERRQMVAPPPPPLPPPVVAVRPVIAAASDNVEQKKERRNYVAPVTLNGHDSSLPPPPPILAPPPPSYMKTALSIRKKRNSLRGQSSSEFSDSSAPSASTTKLNTSPSPSLIAKKSGPLKKIMKKLF